jgi:hypothetical protein
LSKENKWIVVILLLLAFLAVVLYDWFVILPLFSSRVGFNTTGSFLFLIFQVIFAAAIVALMKTWKQIKTLF